MQKYRDSKRMQNDLEELIKLIKAAKDWKKNSQKFSEAENIVKQLAEIEL